MAVSVLKRIALARLFFMILRLTSEMPTASASAVNVIPRSSRRSSR